MLYEYHVHLTQVEQLRRLSQQQGRSTCSGGVASHKQPPRRPKSRSLAISATWFAWHVNHTIWTSPRHLQLLHNWLPLGTKSSFCACPFVSWFRDKRSRGPARCDRTFW